MKAIVERWLALLIFVIFFGCAEEEGPCTLVDDYYKKNLNETLCYLRCLSDALNKLYTDGDQKLLVNEEVYANASRILDDMEGRAGESVRYLSVISGIMEGQGEKLEKLIYYGNVMGDLVAKVGGLFAEVNESVREVKNSLPTALVTANKHYTAIAETVRTVWGDVKAVKTEEDAKCKGEKYIRVDNLKTACGKQTCPLASSLNESNLKKYKDGCLSVSVLGGIGSVSECLNRPRDNLYKNGAVKNSSDILDWKGENGDSATNFQLKIDVQKTFTPLIALFSAGKPPSVLLSMMSNITFLYSNFEEVHGNFTSLLLDANPTDSVNSSDSNI